MKDCTGAIGHERTPNVFPSTYLKNKLPWVNNFLWEKKVRLSTLQAQKAGLPTGHWRNIQIAR